MQPAEDSKKTGIIRITPHQDRSGNSSGSASESENIYRIALEKMKAGDYRGAIADFQKSLSGSSQPALTHQLIGRCYRQLGDFENAKSHLRRALQLFENSKAPGAQAGAEACRRELAAIGG
ncbi:MAG: tetratricopeptide repeat protein [Armatimonadetes bacterium]|nr:MAG: tetratricopeptide repeat protein [Armatimonadota bacterium]